LNFRCGSRFLDLSRPNVMGILNVTPDSFSDGGRFSELSAALAQVESMVENGADIIDVGGESTRPGASVISIQQEMDRVMPVVEAIVERFDIAVSVDTSAALLIREAAAKGVHMLNDVRALQQEGALEAAQQSGLPVCLMHMQGAPETMQQRPEYGDIVEEVLGFLSSRADACISVGIEKKQILLDPGFGFGKTREHNYRLLAELPRLHALGFPILAGLSRKTMIGEATGIETPAHRLSGSLAGAVLCAMNGARILRVHDVKQTVEAMKVVTATLEVMNV
jgi:dihydropteroate synthase